jgi:hypothetical protein
VGYDDGHIAFLSPARTVEKKLESKAARVTALGISPDGKWLASAHADGHVYVWAL